MQQWGRWGFGASADDHADLDGHDSTQFEPVASERNRDPLLHLDGHAYPGADEHAHQHACGHAYRAAGRAGDADAHSDSADRADRDGARGGGCQWDVQQLD